MKPRLKDATQSSDPGLTGRTWKHHLELTPAVEEQGIPSFTTDDQPIVVQPGVAHIVLI